MQADRFNDGKPELSYILTFPNAIKELAQVMMYGAGKYARGNYLKGAPQSQYADSGLRHKTAFLNGEDRDPESGRHHLAHELFNVLMALEMALTKPEFDDRMIPKDEQGQQETTDTNPF